MLSRELSFESESNEAVLNLKKRFEAKYEKADDETSCWEWKAGKTVYGYGIFRMGPHWNTLKNRMYPAHRVSYSLYHGRIPQGICVCHRCDNTSCVNPHHLFLGTLDDNNKDRSSKNRTARLLGEKNPYSRYTDEDIMKIRQSPKTGTELGKEMGIPRNTIYNIRKMRSWKHVCAEDAFVARLASEESELNIKAGTPSGVQGVNATGGTD